MRILALMAILFSTSASWALEEHIVCTDDAKMCPDGTYVGRTAPTCAFAPCPTQPTQPVTTSQPQLQGLNVLRFPVPPDLREARRLIQLGTRTPEGTCRFTSEMNGQPGHIVIQHTIAYDPTTCQSLVVEGTYPTHMPTDGSIYLGNPGSE